MKSLTNLTIWKKISLLMALGLIIGISIFSYLGLRAVNRATDVMLEDRMTTAHVVSDYLDETLGRALAELKSTAQAIRSNAANDNMVTEVQHLVETYHRLSVYMHSVYFINSQGQVLWSEPESKLINGMDISNYESIGKAFKEEKTQISGLISEPITGTPVIFLISPLQSEENGAKFALVATIDVTLSSIGGFVQPIKLGETGYVEIIDQNGIVVTRTEPGLKPAPFEKSEHSGRFAALIAAGEPTRGLCHTCHEPLQKVERRDILAFVPLSEANWGVVIRQSEEEALAPVRELRQNLIVFALLLVVISISVVIMTTRDVINRLKLLTIATKRIAEGDLTTVVPIIKQDEVGILAESVEDMRTKLKASYGDLEQMTKELSSLLTVSEMISRLRDLSDLSTALGGVLNKTLEIIKDNFGSILVLDEEKQVLYCQVNHGLFKKNSSHLYQTMDEGINTQTVRTGNTIIVEDITLDPRFNSLKPILTKGLRGFISIPLRSKEKVLGVLNIASREIRTYSPEEVKFLEGITRQITAAIENARLHREVRQKEEVRGELLQDIFSIQEEERRRIARELHDETSQVIASLNASLEAAVSLLPANNNKANSILRKAQALSINILDDIHKLIYELRPSLLDDLGLVAAVRWLTEVNLETSGINVSFRVSGRQIRLSSQLEVTLFRVIQETVNNIARHSNAKNTIISFQYKKNIVKVRIQDDGLGFDVDEAISSKNRPRGLGLIGMKERIAIVNGTLSIQSHPDGRGTEIIIEIPLVKEVSNAKDKSTNRR